MDSKIGANRRFRPTLAHGVWILYAILLFSLLGYATSFSGNRFNNCNFVSLHSAAISSRTRECSSSVKTSMNYNAFHIQSDMLLGHNTGIREGTYSCLGAHRVGRGDLTIRSASAIEEFEPSTFDIPSFEEQTALTSFDVELTAPQKRHWAILDNPSLLTGRMVVILASAIYGTNFPAVKMLDEAMPLSISASLRFGLAAAVTAIAVNGQQQQSGNSIVDLAESKARKDAFWSGAEVGFWYCIGYIAQAEALHTVSAGKSAFFNALAVIVVPVLDALWNQKLLDRKTIGSIALACLGVGLLELGPTGGVDITSGDLLAFSQTIFFGVGYWRLEAFAQEHRQQTPQLTVGLLSSVAVGATMYALFECMMGHVSPDLITPGQFSEWLTDPFIVGSLLWTGLMSTAAAIYLETVALKVVSATELTLLMTTVSLWGSMFAYIGLGEVLTPIGMLGGGLILGGCILGNIPPDTITSCDDDMNHNF